MASPFLRFPRRSLISTVTARRGLPANLLQAQRDFFGAHTYERDRQTRRVSHRMDRIGSETGCESEPNRKNRPGVTPVNSDSATVRLRRKPDEARATV